MNLIKSDLFQYSILIIILLTGSFLYYKMPVGLPRFFVVCLTSFGYVVWGILHHAVYERLKLWIIIEYLLIASCVIAFFAFSLNLG